MSDIATKTDAPEVSVPLDEVMLAMDVVDTLRHQRQQVAAELDEDQREAALIARVKSIYESQGMDVPDDVIQQGVKALVEDRFVYEPPRRTFAVRLAEVYVERGKWAWRMVFVALAAVALWAMFVIPARMERARQVEAVQSAYREENARLSRLSKLNRTLGDAFDGVRVPDQLATVRVSYAETQIALGRAEKEIERVRRELELIINLEAYPDALAATKEHLVRQQDALDKVETTHGSATQTLQRVRDAVDLFGDCSRALLRVQGVPLPEDERADLEVDRNALLGLVSTGDLTGARRGLRGLNQRIDTLLKARQDRQNNQRELQRLKSRLQGMRLDASVRTELDGWVRRGDAAIQAGDDVATSQALSRLSEEIAVLDQAYELRIVAGRGKRSGVWRNTPGRKRNHYVIVQAVSARGRVLRLPIKNEENNRVERVTSFGVRVSAATYEKVKQDKLDNGIVDNRRFGRKQRGKRGIEFFFPVTGGFLTRW